MYVCSYVCMYAMSMYVCMYALCRYVYVYEYISTSFMYLVCYPLLILLFVLLPHCIVMYLNVVIHIIQVMMIVKATSVLISPTILSGNQPLELIKVVLVPDNKYGLVNTICSVSMRSCVYRACCVYVRKHTTSI